MLPRPPRPPLATTASDPSPTRSASSPCSSKTTVPSGTVTTRSFPFAAVAAGAGAGLAGLGVEVRVIREPREVVQVAGRPEHDVAAPAAVAALRPSLRLVGLAPHRGGAVTAAAGAHLHVDLVHERHAEQPRWSIACGRLGERRREDWHVVEPVIVWMVHLGSGTGGSRSRCGAPSPSGTSGLEFVEKKTGADVRFDYASIRRAKRMRGSPVLMVDWRRTASLGRRPSTSPSHPPWSRCPGRRRSSRAGRSGPFTRATPSKRQVARMNLGYLRSTSAANKDVVKAWAER